MFKSKKKKKKNGTGLTFLLALFNKTSDVIEPGLVVIAYYIRVKVIFSNFRCTYVMYFFKH